MDNLLQQFSDAMADTYGEVQRSLVQLRDRRGSIGAGTVWHADGLIVTNAHVVLDHRYGPRPASRHRHHHRHGHDRKRHQRDLHVVLRDGSTYPAQLLAVDEANDLAALTVDAENLPVITPGDSRTLRPGQWVMALGHPWGVPDALTAGVVIATGGDLPEMRTGREWIALNLRLRPGHSGGPLVDTQGRLVGINTLITGPEVGFAIPVHTVTSFLKQTLGNRVENRPSPVFV